MATAYHNGQPGAPTWSTTVTAGAASAFAYLSAILKGCLVTGYVGRPAAGWELIAESSTYLVLRNGTHSGYICISVSDSSYLDVHLADTFDGMAGNVMAGAGLRSGSGGVKQNFYTDYLAYPGGLSSWFIVADSSTFILAAVGGHTNIILNRAWTGTTQLVSLYAGEDKAGNFLCLGGENRRQTALSGAISLLGHTVLKDVATGLLLGSSAGYGIALPELAQGASISSTNFSDNPIQVGRVPLCESTWVASGRLNLLKGFAHSPALMGLSTTAFAETLGAPAPIMLNNINTTLDLGDAYTYFALPRKSSSYFGQPVVTDNPVFW